MENARVAIFEDTLPVSKVLKETLERQGHQIVATAENIKQARVILKQMSKGKLEIDLLILDSDLSDRRHTAQDALEVTNTIQKEGLNTRTIGFGVVPMNASGVEVDYDCGKNHMWQLAAIIKSIPNPNLTIDC